MGLGLLCKDMGVALDLAHEPAMARSEQWTVEEGECEGRRDSRGQKRMASSDSVKGEGRQNTTTQAKPQD
ncbi:hypothetical protein R70211_05349 [Paraburkholderia domus]|uniref:Uncharacterized protein n=1 Tax=Paraburkholderia domus TaxID=2793075 RepID=A0A9N8N1D8_9BURK|nr:hypothetical protein R70211_05349 [Paraburkholderia domus]